MLPIRAPASAGGVPGGEWMGAAHVPLLCSNVPPAACTLGSVPAGGCGKVVQAVTVEGCWVAAELASVPGSSDTAGRVVGCDGGEGAEGMLLVVMRRVLGSISLARSCGSHEPLASITASRDTNQPLASRDTHQPSASGSHCPSLAHVWREIADESEGRPRAGQGGDGSVGHVGAGGSGGLIPLPGGLWVRVEVGTVSASAHSSNGTICQISNAGSCLRVTVAQEEGPGAVDSDDQMVCRVVHEVQRVADGVAASLSLKGGLHWVLA